MYAVSFSRVSGGKTILVFFVAQYTLLNRQKNRAGFVPLCVMFIL